MRAQGTEAAMTTLTSRPKKPGITMELALDDPNPSVTIHYPNGDSLCLNGPYGPVRAHAWSIAHTLVQAGVWQEIPKELL